MEKHRSIVYTCLIACCCVIGLSESARADPIVFTYNAVQEELLVNSSDFPPVGDAFDQQYELTNNTGQAWIDFHFRLALGPSSFGTMWFPEMGGVPAGGYDGTAYEGPGTYAVSPLFQELSVSDLNIPSGAVYSFNLDSDAFELSGTYNLFGTPSVVPEPSSLLLFVCSLPIGLSILGANWWRRKRII